jgi:putative membrane protein insertion efficiency factor
VAGLVHIPALTARGLIRVYRYTLSSLVGRTCRHLPTCSEFAEDAIGRFGLWPGFWMGLARFSRCRPYGTDGFDPVPDALPARASWYVPWRYGRWSGTEVDTVPSRN